MIAGAGGPEDGAQAMFVCYMLYILFIGIMCARAVAILLDAEGGVGEAGGSCMLSDGRCWVTLGVHSRATACSGFTSHGQKKMDARGRFIDVAGKKRKK